MASPKCRILCVDDHEDTSSMLKLLLAQEDYDVEIARNIEEALAFIQHEMFDLYVLDKRLPDGTGLELCKRLNNLTPEVPCIFYSGDAYEIHRVEALNAGADAYITKPDIEGLINTVNSFLNSQECSQKLEVG